MLVFREETGIDKNLVEGVTLEKRFLYRNSKKKE